MAGASLFTLIDDIASLLDDVATLTKVAAKQTAGVLGDDLALNAEQVAGVASERELPVVWAVARGSVVNKAILVPSALALSALLPVAVTPLLMLGGTYLCFEGVEKLAHKFLHRADAADHAAELRDALRSGEVDLVALERDKIRGAIRTDFILSAEIVTIALGTVAAAPFMSRVLVLSSIAALMTVGVYGLVAGIVKLDDVGLWLMRRGGPGARVGRALVAAAPWLMKGLSVAGTVAMFLVGGGIVSHGIGPLHHVAEAATTAIGAGGGMAVHLAVGIVVGALALALVQTGSRIRAAIR